MQNGIWLLAFLHSLLWFGSLVEGAAVSTSPSNITHILHPQRLNSSNGFWPWPGDLEIHPKQRGPELPVADLFEAGLLALGLDLAPKEFDEFIPIQAWSFSSIFLGVVPKERLLKGLMEKPFVVYGIYGIFLTMWYNKDFRSGAFEIRFDGFSICDVIMFPEGSPELKNQPSFAYVTKLAPPPSSIAHHTNGSSKLVASALEPDLEIQIPRTKPFQPLDQASMLLSLVDMVTNAAAPPKDDLVEKNIEEIVPLTGVKTSINVSVDAKPPRALTYGNIISAAVFLSWNIARGEDYALAATTAILSLDWVYVGEIKLEPYNSSALTRPFIEANVDACADTATARLKRSMVRRL